MRKEIVIASIVGATVGTWVTHRIDYLLYKTLFKLIDDHEEAIKVFQNSDEFVYAAWLIENGYTKDQVKKAMDLLTNTSEDVHDILKGENQ